MRRASARRSLRRSGRDRFALDLDRARRSAARARRAGAPASTCRSRSRRRRRASGRPRARARRRAPPVPAVGRAGRRTPSRARSAREHHLTHVDGLLPAGGDLAGAAVEQRRLLGRAVLVGRGAAEPERAAAAELRRIGRRAADLAQRLAVLGRRAGQRARAAPPCTDACGRAKMSRVEACSTIRPAYMTATRSTSRATTPRSCVTQTTAIPVSACSVSTSSRICCWIVTSSAVVGSSAIEHARRGRERHRDHHPLQHPARELVRDRSSRRAPGRGGRPGRAPRACGRARPRPRTPCARRVSTICVPTRSSGFSELIGSW